MPRPDGSLRPRHLGPAAVLALLAACEDPVGGLQPAQDAWLLDGMLAARAPGPEDAPLLLVGRFEVTREDFGRVPSITAGADLPATMLTRAEAADWAAQRGLRLPTLVEWRHLASADGPGATGYPWGPTFLGARANTLELGLHRALPVGVFESGQNPLGAYDFSGNVWEWVADDPPLPARESPPAEAGAMACGGSYAAPADRARIRSVRFLQAGDRAEDLGFRCVATALPWLRTRVDPLWRDGSDLDRQTIEGAFMRWEPQLRQRLAAELDDAGGSAGLIRALRGPAP